MIYCEDGCREEWPQTFRDLKQDHIVIEPGSENVRCTSAISRRLTRFGELLFDKEIKTWVSTAYYCWSTLNWLVTNWMGEMKEVKRMGPRTEPWGTPVLSWVVEETSWPNFTYWTLRDRKDSSHIRALPSTPYIERSRYPEPFFHSSQNGDAKIFSNCKQVDVGWRSMGRNMACLCCSRNCDRHFLKNGGMPEIIYCVCMHNLCRNIVSLEERMNPECVQSSGSSWSLALFHVRTCNHIFRHTAMNYNTLNVKVVSEIDI